MFIAEVLYHTCIYYQLRCQELPQRLAQPGAAQKLRERLLEELRKEWFFREIWGSPGQLKG